ncbi:MAG: hypothetical protein M3R15_05000 [Acidobacteriota bacterium]|nr:hypothetical protein [Acidobacteriota bacterium]
MLKMDQVYVIRHKLHVEGRSERAVARQLGLSRNTIARYRLVTEAARQGVLALPSPLR